MADPPTYSGRCVNVELDIFSGMPNPTWQLCGAAAADVLTMLAALPPTSQKSLATPLGYRGLALEILGDPTPVRVRVYRGVAEVAGQRSRHWLVDPDRKLERLLLKSAVPAVSQEILDHVDIELAP